MCRDLGEMWEMDLAGRLVLRSVQLEVEKALKLIKVTLVFNE